MKKKGTLLFVPRLQYLQMMHILFPYPKSNSQNHIITNFIDRPILRSGQYGKWSNSIVLKFRKHNHSILFQKKLLNEILCSIFHLSWKNKMKHSFLSEESFPGASKLPLHYSWMWVHHRHRHRHHHYQPSLNQWYPLLMTGIQFYSIDAHKCSWKSVKLRRKQLWI